MFVQAGRRNGTRQAGRTRRVDTGAEATPGVGRAESSFRLTERPGRGIVAAVVRPAGEIATLTHGAAVDAPGESGRLSRPWMAALAAWTLVVCFVPDPRPLSAPEWIVAAVRSVSGAGEPAARALATLALRAGGLALLGALVTRALGARRLDRRGAVALALAPCLAIATLWVNHGWFPIALQCQAAAASALVGGLLALAVRRSRAAGAVLAVAAVGLFSWGTATGIGDDLYAEARAVARHVLATAATVPDGDEGFAQATQSAFRFAGDASPGSDPLRPNRAAILALSAILGDERVADVAGRSVARESVETAKALRARITLHGRKDWAQHFWVSAGLTVLSDADRSIAVGLTKELMDATPGGTGFSFADLAADAAGNRLAQAATRDATAARELQARFAMGLRAGDVCPELGDLPEGITRDDFVARYGGLGGAETDRLVAEIRRRLDACPALR
jgi:hypothetical protein